jgi:hypothetical protein
MIQHQRDSYSMHSAILSTASLLLPRPHRADWLAEWRSELWYVIQSSDDPPRRRLWDRTALLFCLGSFKDAMWLRRNSNNTNPRKYTQLQSPSHCLFFLMAIAAVGITYFFRSSGHYDMFMRTAQVRVIIFSQLLLIAMASLALPIFTSLALGEYPTTSRSPVRAMRFWRWIFLCMKIVLIVVIVFCATLAFARAFILPQATLAGYLLGFRWALTDQKRRCPVCLRLLANPARIGQPSQILLGWYGTEYFCARGHGLMYVPGIRTTYSKQRWLDLDSSWGSLFS